MAMIISQKNENIKASKTYIGANALFNFMRKYEYLESTLKRMSFIPRYYPETVDYLNIMIGEDRVKEWYIPMCCFCDIPLHQLSVHAEGDNGYGKFGIALHKQFGISRGISPIHYINNSSVETESLSIAFNSMLATKDIDDEPYVESMESHILDYVRLVKPLFGKMKRRKLNSEEWEIVEKNFHDEHEWRYIPQSNSGFFPDMLVTERQKLSEAKSHLYTNSLSDAEDTWLKFEAQDIRYIFVDNHESVKKLVSFIRTELEENIQDILLTKIVVYNDISEDW